MSQGSANTRPDRLTGSLLSAAGAGGILWMLLYRLSEGSHIPRPPMTAALWLVASFGLLGWGLRLLWHSEHPRSGWAPSSPGQRFHSLVLYSRNDCCLCEDAVELLAEYRDWLPPIVEVDIDADPELLEQYDDVVPVVAIDGRIRFKSRIEEVLLRRLIEGTRPIAALRERV